MRGAGFMVTVNTLVLTGFGTNSHIETAHTARLAGSERVDIVHFSDLVSGEVKLSDYQFLIFPGGFLDGDDLGAAQAAQVRFRYVTLADQSPLQDHLLEFLHAGKMILGICNGFQLLVKLGILPALNGKWFERTCSLGHNLSARFEDRWVRLLPNPKSPCLFTKDLPILEMPVRHGEGRLVVRDESVLQALSDQNLIALQYIDPKSDEPTMDYPANPNGSPLACAGLTDPTGHVLGLMPHPEAFHHITNYPTWTGGFPKCPPATLLFRNAITYLRNA